MKLRIFGYVMKHSLRIFRGRTPLAVFASAALALAACAPGKTAQRDADDRPNIVVIMADDLGFSDLGSYGGEIRTPNLDQLASGGLRFTQFYNTARCYPTRASLLTGLYPHQAGIGAGTFDRGLPGYRGHLTDNTVTIAEVLRDAGYRTGMVGKWHVSNTVAREDEQEQLAWLAHRAAFGPFSPIEQYPTHRGFEDYYGNIWGVVDFFDPFSLVNGAEAVTSVPEGYYHTDAISDSAVAYVDRYAREDRPYQGIGRLIAKLEETGELDNTLILFLSDNGASPERPSTFGPGFDRAGSTRDGRTVTFPVDKETLPGPQTVHAGIGPRWANVANTPFRFWKARAHEGGITTPLIVYWSEGMRAVPGSITEQPGHVIDIMATALDAAGVPYPGVYEGHEITPLAGRSLLPILRGEQREGHDALYWEHMGSRAIRSGDWKLVSAGRDQPWELYDLSRDRTELHDVSAQFPERVRELERQWDEWARHSQVLPRPD